MRTAYRFAVGLMALVATMGAGHAKTLFGFTPFPYDATPEAVARTAEIARNNSSLYALHFDDGVPWEELMEGKPLPRKVQREWDDLARAIPGGRPVYVGLSPLAKDRKSLAPAQSDKDKVSLPWNLRLASLDDDKVKAAYLEYARRAIRQFKPTFLNIGIEAGEMASRDPKHWPQFEELYRHVRSALKREYPDVKVGISFGLQSLRKPDVAKHAKALVEDSDYLGLSFYPHASPFGERFGEPRLGDAEEAWREPLKWVRGYTTKPIAVCETGYLSTTVTLKSFNLTLKGDQNLQTSYVRELAQTAERDQYLFVVWFLAVDYDRLYARMGSSPGNDVNLLWRNIGLWNGDVKPKPAWEEWKRAVAGNTDKTPPTGAAPPPAESKPSVPEREAAPSTPNPSAADVGFTSERQLFQAGPGSETVLDRGNGMRWSFEYKSSDWSWMLRDLGFALPPSASRMKLRLRSDRPGTLFVQLEESGGETFFAMIDPKDDWLDVNIDLKSLKADPAKRRDGVLQPEKIVKLLVADPAGRDKAQGHRTVWFQRWSFE